MNSRRSFIQILPVTGAALFAARFALAADVDPKDAQATALGYVVDATKADKAKYPQYAAGQTCTVVSIAHQGWTDSALVRSQAS